MQPTDEWNEILLEGCRTGDLFAVVKAVGNGADVHYHGDMPMFYAATRGHTFIAQHLWVHAPQPRMFHVGQGTLRKTLERGHDDLVRFLAPFATVSELTALIQHPSSTSSIRSALEQVLISKKTGIKQQIRNALEPQPPIVVASSFPDASEETSSLSVGVYDT
jgi:hypothetical protein